MPQDQHGKIYLHGTRSNRFWLGRASSPKRASLWRIYRSDAVAPSFCLNTPDCTSSAGIPYPMRHGRRWRDSTSLVLSSALFRICSLGITWSYDYGSPWELLSSSNGNWHVSQRCMVYCAQAQSLRLLRRIDVASSNDLVPSPPVGCH